MIAALLAVMMALSGVPLDLPVTSEFALGGFTLPGGCLVPGPGCVATVVDRPWFMAETDRLRPYVLVSWVPAADGRCQGAELESVDGHTLVYAGLSDMVEVRKGERVFTAVVLRDADERGELGVKGSAPFLVGMACFGSGGGGLTWSQVYSIGAGGVRVTAWR